MVMADCPYNKIAVMQLFYELKQKFPTIPDQVVTDFMHQAAYNREECEKKLLQEYQRYQSHSYPMNIVDKMTEGKERPKTLSLQNVGTNLDMFRRQPRTTRWYVPPIQEQRESGCVALPANKVTDTTRDNVKSDVELSQVNESVKNIEISSNQSDVFVSDLKLRFQNDNCGCERTSLRVKYKKNANGASHSAPTTPSSFQKSIASDASNVRKHRSSLNVDRPMISPCDTKRPFTSVNLTLRPPSTDPQPPINISTKGSNLTYSTCSSKQGYQNQLQISISEEGNTTLSASRMKASPTTNPDSEVICDTNVSDTCSSLEPHFEKPLSSAAELRLREQIERKNRLEMELNRDKVKLKQMRQEVVMLEDELKNRQKIPIVSREVALLRAEVRALQNACYQMINEIDMADLPSSAFVPIGNDGGNWMCVKCTFKNHPLLYKCEQCDMVRPDDLRNIIPNIRSLHTTSPHLPAIHPHV